MFQHNLKFRVYFSKNKTQTDSFNPLHAYFFLIFAHTSFHDSTTTGFTAVLICSIPIALISSSQIMPIVTFYDCTNFIACFCFVYDVNYFYAFDFFLFLNKGMFYSFILAPLKNDKS